MTGDRSALGVIAIREALDKIRPLLFGLGPGVQGGILAELVAQWLAGHPAEVREGIFALHIETVRKLTDVNAVPLDAIRRSLHEQTKEN